MANSKSKSSSNSDSQNNNKETQRFKIGPDGVAQIYPTAKGGTEVYMGNSKDGFDEDIFNVSFGNKSHLKYDSKKQGKLNYYNTEGSKINYNSGAKSGRSTRIDTYPGGGMWDNDTKFWYKDNPGYLYNEKGIKNGEFTTYIRVHDALGTHQAYAHKVGGRDQDALRSLAEMVYPTDGKSQVAFNYNYAHFPYVHAKAKTYGKLDEFGDDYGWLGLKTIHVVKDGFTHWEMWMDADPVAEDGSLNNNWEMIAEYKDEGCDEYDNIPVTWKCHKEVCRIDGFANVDFALFSDREIDDSDGTTLGVEESKPQYSKEVTGDQSKPVIDNSQSGISEVEMEEVNKWMQDAVNKKVADIIKKIAEQGQAQQQNTVSPPTPPQQQQSDDTYGLKPPMPDPQYAQHPDDRR